MQRRDFVKVASLAAAGGLLTTSAQAQAPGGVTWKLSSAFPAALDAIGGGAETLARAVGEASDGRFRIEVHAAGELASALDAFELVGKGQIDCAYTALHYYWGVEPALVFATGVPFGMNARQQNAFFLEGNGTDLINDILVAHNLYALPAGNTGCQMGGWFRNEMKSAADLKGLKIRISGIAAKIFQKLGAVPQAVGRSDMLHAFETGALDAAAWVAPYDDEKLGLTKVAPYYYYPGWFQSTMALHLIVNLTKWNTLSKANQALVRQAAALANAGVQARYDALNPAALRRLATSGLKLRGFPGDMMDACWQAAADVYREIADGDAKFRSLHEAYMNFRNDEYLWWQVAEYPYDNYVIRQRAKGA